MVGGDVEKKESRERRGNFKTRLRTETPMTPHLFLSTTRGIMEIVFFFKFELIFGGEAQCIQVSLNTYLELVYGS